MTDKNGKIFVAAKDDVCVIKLVGDIRVTLCSSIDNYIEKVFATRFQFRSILIDMMETTAIDSTSLGLLAKMSLYAQKKFAIKPTIFSTNPSITKLLEAVGFSQIFNIETRYGCDFDAAHSKELKMSEACNERKVREKVIEAHRILMDINSTNRETFRELVSTLEENKAATR